MSEHAKVTTFFRRVIPCDDSDERRKLKKSVARVQAGERFVVKCYTSVVVEFLVVVILCIGAMVAFLGLLTSHRKKLKRLPDAHQLVTRHQELHPGKPDITWLPGGNRGFGDRESFPGAAEHSGYHGGLASPSWRSNRLCG